MLITSTTNTVCLKCWLGDDDDDFGTILEWVTSDEESEAFYDGDPREANRDPLNMAHLNLSLHPNVSDAHNCSQTYARTWGEELNMHGRSYIAWPVFASRYTHVLNI